LYETTLSNCCRLFCAVILCLPALAGDHVERKAFTAPTATRAQVAELWTRRSPSELNVLDRAGGSGQRPGNRFTFVKEDTSGTSPKFEIVDENGVHWKAKLGEESRPETAATRLVWAAGYFTDTDYYLPVIHVAQLPSLHRGQPFVSAGGTVHGVRLEHKLKAHEADHHWSWFANPFSGSRELNGLKVLMALVNNWDLKDINNDVKTDSANGRRYVVADLGSTFGRTGNTLRRSKSNLRDYESTHFIQKITPEYVDFHMSSRPFFLTVFDLPYYISRTRMQRVVKHIPRTHARWIGDILGQLSGEQIRDCFRSAGYTTPEVDGFARIVEQRIAELKRL
jgi:hypothetical protein